MKIFAALFLSTVAGAASASEVLNLGSYAQNSTVMNQNITGMLTGSGYTSVQVSVNWSAISGDPYSNEAIWALTNDTLANATVFYADPGPAANSASNGNAVTLNWNVLFGQQINSSTPLWFLSLQTFGGSVANWGNVTLTFGNDTIPAPSATHLGIVASASDIFDLGSEGSDFDTEIGLYNSAGGLIASDDDSGVDATSLLTGLQLEAGTYYFSVSGWNTTFANGFGSVPASDSEGGDIAGLINGIAYSGTVGVGGVTWYSFEVVPAPSSLALLGMGGLIANRRRRA